MKCSITIVGDNYSRQVDFAGLWELPPGVTAEDVQKWWGDHGFDFDAYLRSQGCVEIECGWATLFAEDMLDEDEDENAE